MAKPKVYKRLPTSYLQSETRPVEALTSAEKQKVESILSDFFTHFETKHSS